MKRFLGSKPSSVTEHLKKYPDHTVTIIGGLLGAGKTTYFQQLIQDNRDMLAGVVMNEGGNDVDGQRIQDALTGTRMELFTVAGACGCCEGENDMQVAIGAAAKKHSHIITEFSGLADALRSIALFTAREMRVRMAYLLHCGQAEQGGALTNTYQLIPAVIPALGAADLVCLTHWEGRGLDMNKLTNQINAARAGLPTMPTFQLRAPRRGVETFADDSSAPMRASIKALLGTEARVRTTTLFFMNETGTKGLEVREYRAEQAFSRQSFTRLLESHGIIRAKGVARFWRGGLVEKREFNWTNGTLTIERVADEDLKFVAFTTASNHSAFAASLESTVDTVTEPDDYRFNHDPELKLALDVYVSGDTDAVRSAIKSKTDTLVGQYHQYMALEKAKNNADNPDDQQRLGAEQSILGDAMTYPDPITWIAYKHEAYRGSTGAITTVGEFLAHCIKSPTYICGKRLAFLQEYWLKTYGQPFLGENGRHTHEQNLASVAADRELFAIVQKSDFIQRWHRYEYYGEMKQGLWRVAKWQSF